MLTPFITLVFELLLWQAVFRGSGKDTIAGFNLQNYLAYAIWGSYFARIGANWMYESRMIEDVNTGKINSLLLRPTSFYEYFLFQFLGYKMLIVVTSLAIPTLCILFLGFDTHFMRLPLALLLMIYFLVFTYTLSFIISSFAFFLNKIHSFTFSKNIVLWVITGELFPLDLIPQPYQAWFVASPFASGVFVPVGYLTGRLQLTDVMNGFLSVTLGILVLSIVGSLLWKFAMKQYSGTGA